MSSARFLAKLLDEAEVTWVELGEVTQTLRGKRLTKKQLSEGAKYPVFHGGLDPLGFYQAFNRPAKTAMVINVGASAGTVGYSDVDFWSSDGCFCLKHAKALNSKFLYYFLSSNEHQIKSKVRFAGIPTLDAIVLERMKIPIPSPDDPEKSLAIQGEIVRILDSFTLLAAELTAELTSRKKQYNHYRDQLLTFDEGEVEWKAFGEVFNIFAGGDKPKDAFSEVETQEFNVPVLSNGIGEKSLYGWTNQAKVNEPSLTVSARGTIGWTSYRDRPIFPIIRLLVLTPKIKLNLRYAYHYMKTVEKNYKVPDAGIPQLTKPMIQDVPFPIPHPNDPQRSIEVQDRIAAILDTFDTLTTSLTAGLPREIVLRERQYAYYRDQLLSFPKPDAEAA